MGASGTPGERGAPAELPSARDRSWGPLHQLPGRGCPRRPSFGGAMTRTFCVPGTCHYAHARPTRIHHVGRVGHIHQCEL